MPKNVLDVPKKVVSKIDPNIAFELSFNMNAKGIIE